jgi:hypothetical protein
MTEKMKAFEGRNTVSALFLNIKSSYDSVRYRTLMNRLKAVGFSGNLLAFICNLVFSRELETNYGWLDLKDWTYKGLPQVSVPSPTLYSRYMAGPKYKISQKCKVLEYTDDMTVNRQQNWLIGSGKKHTKYSCLCKGMCLADSTKNVPVVYFR